MGAAPVSSVTREDRRPHRSIEDFANLPADGVDAAVDTDIRLRGGGLNHGRWKLFGALIATSSPGPGAMNWRRTSKTAFWVHRVGCDCNPHNSSTAGPSADWPTNRRRCDGLRRWLPQGATPDEVFGHRLGEVGQRRRICPWLRCADHDV